MVITVKPVANTFPVWSLYLVDDVNLLLTMIIVD